MSISPIYGSWNFGIAVTTVILSLAGFDAKSQPYTFRTLAGDIGFGNTDGTNLEARFNWPQGVAVDCSGTIYVADTGNHTIRRLTSLGTNWVTTTLAGSPGQWENVDGLNDGARFYSPFGIAADPAGNLYVPCRGSHTIRQMSAVGTNWIVKTIAGSAGAQGNADGTNSEARFKSPEGLTIDPTGNIYVADTGNHTIRKLSLIGTDWVVTTYAGAAGTSGSLDGPRTDARFKSPEGVVVDKTGNVFVADTLNNTFRKIGSDGTVSTVAGLAGSSGSADGYGNLARFNLPRGIAVDRDGTLYIADTGNYTVRRIAPTGTNWMVTTLAGTALYLGTRDGTNGSAQFTLPYAIAVDTATNLYIADSYNHTIRKVAPLGGAWVVSTLAGVSSQGVIDGPNSGARFFQPAGIALVSSGALYVSDMRNNTIRRIAPRGVEYVVTTLAGNPTNFITRTDGTNTQATFWEPQGLALDSTGNIYVADSHNNAIRKIAPIGTNWVTGTLATGLDYPNALALDPAGNIYVANSSSHNIVVLRPSGTRWLLSPVAGLARTPGRSDGTNSDAKFYFPNGLAIDPQTNIYVADSFNNAIRQITPDGTNWVVTTIAGACGPTGGLDDGTNEQARFVEPLGVALDGAGNLFVSQLDRVRKLTHSGTNWVVTTVTGAGPPFLQPNSLTVDNEENLYVTDTSHNVIRIGQPLYALHLEQRADRIMVSWTAEARGFVLETTSTLSPSAWIPLTNGIVLSGSDLVFTNGTPAKSAFYRLHEP